LPTASLSCFAEKENSDDDYDDTDEEAEADTTKEKKSPRKEKESPRKEKESPRKDEKDASALKTSTEDSTVADSSCTDDSQVGQVKIHALV
jgi:FtsZ-interacting cell division protein YlmF